MDDAFGSSSPPLREAYRLTIDTRRSTIVDATPRGYFTPNWSLVATPSGFVITWYKDTAKTDHKRTMWIDRKSADYSWEEKLTAAQTGRTPAVLSGWGKCEPLKQRF